MIRFGILGAARIAPQAVIDPAKENPLVEIQCIAARDVSRAQIFADDHCIPDVHDHYQQVIADPAINAVYVPLPISGHHEWTIKALHAGKHVLCEKSLALNEAQAIEMQAAARSTGLVLMDAFHYRYHPLFIRAVEIVQSGVLGKLSMIEADFHVKGPVADDDIRMMYQTGGGVTMDIGCYPLSWVRHLLGTSPLQVSARAETGPAQVDIYMETDMQFPGGIRAKTTGDMRAGGEFKARINLVGDAGSLRIENPLVPQFGHSLALQVAGKKSTVSFDLRSSYAYQLDAFVNAVTNGEPVLTDGRDGILQMALIDRVYQAAGLSIRGRS
jgi:predicted dehydrogenase